MRLHGTRAAVLATAIVGAAALAPSASAADTTSTNWAGYAVTRSGTRYRSVSGRWTVPTVDCASTTSRRYSAVWVGLGGYSSASEALEQTGTEADCSSGTAHYSSWYELVPDVSHSARLTVRPGDRMAASVAVSGHRVTVRLRDLTRHTTFRRTLTASVVDTSSAEWIVEAPSLCRSSASSSDCTVQGLANFGTQTIAGATATSTTGHRGTISDSAWTATSIDLQATDGDDSGFGPQRVSEVSSTSAATTGETDGAGSGFAVTYVAGSTSTEGPSSGRPQFARRGAAVAAG